MSAILPHSEGLKTMRLPQSLQNVCRLHPDLTLLITQPLKANNLNNIATQLMAKRRIHIEKLQIDPGACTGEVKQAGTLICNGISYFE